MTDIVPDGVDPDSKNVTPADADVDRFLDQLDLFDEQEHHVIAFTGSTFDALRGYYDEEVETEENDIQTFSATSRGMTLHVYRMSFYRELRSESGQGRGARGAARVPRRKGRPLAVRETDPPDFSHRIVKQATGTD